MFQQPDKYFNGQATQIRAEQCDSHGSNPTSVQVMGMGWQQNEYGMRHQHIHYSMGFRG